jgi:hypothetical protein
MAMMEWRRHPRVREEIPVRWAMPDKGIQGSGIVRNVSISGLLLEVDEHFKPIENAPFTLEILDEKAPRFIPKEARVVWSDHIMADKRRKFCGLRFVDPTGPTFSCLKEHIDSRLDAVLQATDLNIINHYLHQSN